MTQEQEPNTIFFTDAKDESIYTEESLFGEDEFQVSRSAAICAVYCGCFLGILSILFCTIYFY